MPNLWAKGTLVNSYWWQGMPWREQQETLLKLGSINQQVLQDTSKFFRQFNPICSHDRTSYDIMNCDACAQFTATILAGKSAEAVDADREAETDS